MPPLTRRPLTEQERNLWILRGLGLVLLLLFSAAVVALYFGRELPPAEMHSYHTSSTGYAAPPRPGVHPVGSIPRGTLPPETADSVLIESGSTADPAPGPHSEPERAVNERPGPASEREAGRTVERRRHGAHPEHEHGGSSEQHASIPPAAQNLRNPLTPTPQTLVLGKRAYQVNCAMCHGQTGEEIGPVGERYVPRPPNLSAHVPSHSAGALYYVISHGIRSTPTPEAAQYLPRQWHAFRAEVPAKERWAIVTYLQHTLGQRGAAEVQKPAGE